MEIWRVGQRAVEFVEAAVGRSIFVAPAQMPLSDRAGGVAQRLQSLRHRRLRKGQTALLGDAVELVPETRLIPAGHQPGPRGTAIRPRNVSLCKTDPVFRDRIDVWRRYVLRSLKSVLSPTDVVAENHQEVRLILRTEAESAVAQCPAAQQHAQERHREPKT